MNNNSYSVDEILKEVAAMRNASKPTSKPIKKEEQNPQAVKEVDNTTKPDEEEAKKKDYINKDESSDSIKNDDTKEDAPIVKKRFTVNTNAVQRKFNPETLIKNEELNKNNSIPDIDKKIELETNTNESAEKSKPKHEKINKSSEIEKTMVFEPIKDIKNVDQELKSREIAETLDKQLQEEEIGFINEKPKTISNSLDFDDSFVIGGKKRGKHTPDHVLKPSEINNQDLHKKPLKLKLNKDAIDLTEEKKDSGFTIVDEIEPEKEPDNILENNEQNDFEEFEDDQNLDIESILDNAQKIENQIPGKTRRSIKQVKIEYGATPSDNDNEIEDYKTIEDAEPIKRDLDRKKAKITRQQLITDLMFVLSFIITIIPCVSSFSLPFIDPYENTFNFLIANALVLGIAIIANFGSIIRGFFNMFILKADINTATAIAAIAVAVQSGLGFINITQISKYQIPLFTAVAIFSLSFNLRGKKSMVTRIRDNFRLVATSTVKQSCFVADDDFCEAIENEGFIGTPSVACSKSVLNLRNYLENSFCEDPSDSLSRTLAPIGFLAFIATLIITYRGTNNLMLSISYGAAVAAISAPITSLLCTNTPIKSAAKKMRERGGLISGYNAVEEFSDVDCIAIDADELFPAGSVELVSLRAMGDISIEDVILQAASVTINAGGPLADVFDKIIDGRRKMLPKVSALEYEDNMGLSGSIDGKIVRVGNRSLMERYSITGLPERRIDENAAKNDSFVVYTSIDGKVCGLFAVKYNCTDVDIDECIYDTVRSGISIAIKTNDPNVTSELIEKLFDIPKEYIVIMPAHIAEYYDEMTVPQENGDSCMSHNNNILAYSNMVLACKALKTKTIISVILQTLLVLGGFGVCMFLSVTQDLFNIITPLNIILYQLGTAVLVMGIPALIKKIK